MSRRTPHKTRPAKPRNPAPRPSAPAPPRLGEPLRLNKALARAGVTSRRGADELIAAGKVLVNGGPAEAGMQVVPGKDVVTVDGAPVDLVPAETAEHEYILLNKPTHTVTTMHDPQGRKTVLDLLPEELRDKRVVPVGRLDFFSEGLLLLTTDGDLTHRLTHPSHHLPKVYRLRVRGQVDKDTLATMQQGMTLAEGEKLAPVTVTIVRTLHDSVILEMTLIQGINRQIRRMCRDLDLTILWLRRVSQGPVSLGKLDKGAWRRLYPDEVGALYRAVDLKEPGR